jgi:hypothetical protein
LRLALAGLLSVPALAQAQFTFSNTTPIQIPAPPGTSGPATPYPSPITVNLPSCPGATVSQIRARVLGFAHTWPLDVDVLLQPPLGQALVLFGDRCGTSSISGVNLTFEDGSPLLPTGTCTSWTYSPGGGLATVSFPLPAPAGPYVGTFGALNLIGFPPSNSNGTWNLWVVDDFAGDTGQFANGWQIEFDITGACPPIFGYTPSPPGPVNGTHTTGNIGSTANLSIGVSVATAGIGTGAAATTTVSCSPPPPPFSGFSQTPTAVGAGPVSPTSITGTCTVAATTQTATLSCTENRGGTPVPINFNLVCPAATNIPPTLALTPPPGSTITGSGGGFVGSTANFSIAGTITNPGTGTGAGATTTFSCTPPGPPFSGFTGTMQAVGNGPLTGSPITGTCTVGPAPVTVTMTCQLNQGGTITNVSYQLVCPAGIPAPQAIDTLDRFGLLLLGLLLLGFGAYAVRRLV